MSRLGINTGSNPNDGQGDPLRVAMGKINSNFLEVYNTFGDGFTITSYASTSGIATVARNLTNSPRINVSGILNTGITTTEHLEVRNITSTGVVTATQFVGDGSQLSNVTSTASGVSIYDDNVFLGVARELDFDANIVSTSPDGTQRVRISAQGITSLSQLNVSGVSTLGTLRVSSGVVTATSGIITYYGDGSKLTGIVGGGSGTNYWTQTNTGIITTGGVGIGTTQPLTVTTTGLGTNPYTYSLYVNGEKLGLGRSEPALYVNGSSWVNGLGLRWTQDRGYLFSFPDVFVVQVSGDDGINIFSYIDPDELNREPFRVWSNSNFRSTLQIGTSFYSSTPGISDFKRGVFIDGGNGGTIAVGAAITMHGILGIITASKFVAGSTGSGTSLTSSQLTVVGNGRFTGVVTASSFIGDGSGLTGVVASGSGVIIRDDGSLVGTAGTIDFGSNLTVSAISAGVVTVTGAAGGGTNYWNETASGINTTSNVGIGTTVSTSKLTVEGDARFSGVVTATRFQSTSAGTPTIDSPNNLNINAVTVAISTDVTVGRDIYAGINTSTGLILRSPNGSKYRLVVDNSGNLSTVLVP